MHYLFRHSYIKKLLGTYYIFGYFLWCWEYRAIWDIVFSSRNSEVSGRDRLINGEVDAGKVYPEEETLEMGRKRWVGFGQAEMWKILIPGYNKQEQVQKS